MKGLMSINWIMGSNALAGKRNSRSSRSNGSNYPIHGEANLKSMARSMVRIAAKSGVTTNIAEPGDYAGFPAVPIHEWRKSMVAFRKIGRDPHFP